MLREYLISEAMHALGIPTTRSLSVVATGRDIQRTGAEPGAVLAVKLQLGRCKQAAHQAHHRVAQLGVAG